ncbi:mitochondrial fission process protein 1 [Limosa lapponica baueri]|uniref:Mitochondrial fission process protein 1 n=1 Tax=Limosa lapponica baueri TaxID=1758121 RepID=A0A2I0URX4_LIMLA|nr:mitochondrial fission process protein 1 [Limosa lapponica baueri]
MPLSKGEEYSGPRDCGVDWQVFKLDVKGEGGDNIRPVLEAPEAIGIWETQIKHHKGRPPEEQHKGNGAFPASKSVALGGQLKCLYTNARSMGKKQEELEAIVWHESYDVVAITEMWWDESNDWSAAMEGYKLFRRDRQGRRGGGVALYVREDYECVELTEGNGRVECLWVRIKGRASKADIVVGVCYRPPNQDVEVDEMFYKQLVEVSRSLALVLVGDFNLPDISWGHNTAERE